MDTLVTCCIMLISIYNSLRIQPFTVVKDKFLKLF